MSLHPHIQREVEAAATVESFSLWLEDFSGTLAEKSPVAAIESRLLEKLKSPVRLLRWAIVRVEGARFLCEGAYLRLP